MQGMGGGRVRCSTPGVNGPARCIDRQVFIDPVIDVLARLGVLTEVRREVDLHLRTRVVGSKGHEVPCQTLAMVQVPG